jgi:hypothetical protein
VRNVVVVTVARVDPAALSRTAFLAFTQVTVEDLELGLCLIIQITFVCVILRSIVFIGILVTARLVEIDRLRLTAFARSAFAALVQALGELFKILYMSYEHDPRWSRNHDLLAWSSTTMFTGTSVFFLREAVSASSRSSCQSSAVFRTRPISFLAAVDSLYVSCGFRGSSVQPMIVKISKRASSNSVS